MAKLPVELIEFLRLLRIALEGDYRGFVERWTSVDCFYEIVVRAIYNKVALYFSYDKIHVSDRAARRAIAEVIRSSPLHTILEIDQADGHLQYSKTVDDEAKESISQILLDGTKVIPTPMQSPNGPCE